MTELLSLVWGQTENPGLEQDRKSWSGVEQKKGTSPQGPKTPKFSPIPDLMLFLTPIPFPTLIPIPIPIHEHNGQ